MNKFLVYPVIAILLGTVTMVAPLVVLESFFTIPEGNYTVKAPDLESSEQERGSDNEGTFETNDMVTSPEAPEHIPEPDLVPSEPSEPKPQEPEAWIVTLSRNDSSSSLYSIGLMIVPSFLIALGSFVYLKKRMV